MSTSLGRRGRAESFSNEPRDSSRQLETTISTGPSYVESPGTICPNSVVQRILSLRRAGDKPTSPSGDSHVRATRNRIPWDALEILRPDQCIIVPPLCHFSEPDNIGLLATVPGNRRKDLVAGDLPCGARKASVATLSSYIEIVKTLPAQCSTFALSLSLRPVPLLSSHQRSTQNLSFFLGLLNYISSRALVSSWSAVS